MALRKHAEAGGLWLGLDIAELKRTHGCSLVKEKDRVCKICMEHWKAMLSRIVSKSWRITEGFVTGFNSLGTDLSKCASLLFNFCTGLGPTSLGMCRAQKEWNDWTTSRQAIRSS